MRALIAFLAFFVVEGGCAEHRAVPDTAAASSTANSDVIVDALYAEYGGPREPKNPPPPTGAGTSYSEAWANQRQRMQTQQMEPYGGGQRIEGAIKRGGVDTGPVDREQRASDARALFEARCESVGHGEEPEWGDDEHARKFFDRLDVRARCADVVRLQSEAKRGR
jgi:hypothetical protein